MMIVWLIQNIYIYINVMQQRKMKKENKVIGINSVVEIMYFLC